MIYPSKKDWWVVLLYLPITLMVIGLGGLILYLAVLQNGPTVLLVGGFVPILVGGLLLWFYLGIGCEISPPHLIIHCGPLRWPIPLDRIAEIRRKQGFSPELGWNFALSRDRLFITYRKANGQPALMGVAVSPEDQEGFLQELAEAAPAVNVSTEGRSS